MPKVSKASRRATTSTRRFGKSVTSPSALSRWLRRVKIAAFALVAICLVTAGLLWWFHPDVSTLIKENPRTTAFIELRKEQAASKGQPLRLRWTWRKLAQVSPYLRHAVVAAEDGKFWKHEGVDWDSMEQVAKETWETRSMKRGGSTITQQLAKNLYLSPSKNPLRKLRELFIARSLESALSKDRILELYLNIAEWGDGVFGAEAASRRWFGVSASGLTPAQAARLAVALPNPFKRSANNRAAWLDRKAARLVRSMRGARVITEAQLVTALADLGQE